MSLESVNFYKLITHRGYLVSLQGAFKEWNGYSHQDVSSSRVADASSTKAKPVCLLIFVLLSCLYFVNCTVPPAKKKQWGFFGRRTCTLTPSPQQFLPYNRHAQCCPFAYAGDAGDQGKVSKTIDFGRPPGCLTTRSSQ